MAYVRTRLGRWFFEEGGTKSRDTDATIVLLHSLLCDGGMWRGQVPALEALGRVVTIDGPGHGKSDVPPPFTLDEHARARVAAVDALAIPRALIVGLSWGGMVAMRLALYRPEMLAGMVLLDTSADGTLLNERVEYGLMCRFARRFGLPPVVVRKKIGPLMFSPTTLRTRPAMVDEFVRSVGGYSREGLDLATHAVSIDRPSILESLRAIRVPTLIGYGDDDAATPGDHSRRIASRIPGAKLVSFKNAGHLSALEDPAQVNDAIVPFVREHLSV